MDGAGDDAVCRMACRQFACEQDVGEFALRIGGDREERDFHLQIVPMQIVDHAVADRGYRDDMGNGRTLQLGKQIEREDIGGQMVHLEHRFQTVCRHVPCVEQTPRIVDQYVDPVDNFRDAGGRGMGLGDR